MGYAERSSDPHLTPVQGIYEGRLRQFIDDGGQYQKLNLPKFYDKERISLDQDHVKVQWYQVAFEKGSSPVSPDKRPPWDEIARRDKNNELLFRDAWKHQPFGPSWSTTWFKVELDLPKEWVDSDEQLLFEWDCNNEGIVIDPETLIPKTAFSGGGERNEYLLPKGLKHHSFYIECGNNGMFGCGFGESPPNDNRYFNLDKADIVWPNWDARALFIDFWMLSDAARELPNDSWQKHKARQVGNSVMNLFDPEDVTSVQRCRDLAHKEYFDKYSDSPEVYQKGDTNVMTDVFSMGNCHIDTAWLWPFAETRRKIVRSWTSQCTLMDKYPEYQFVASQAQQFKWLLKEHRNFFKDVLIPKIQQSQFFPIGGSWVENDTNIPSGESLCRQFFLGQRFFLKHFGKKSDVFWLPDTFGYSSQIPQIARISGIDKFLTQKLSWNNINNFPHTSFNWVGIDGSQLLTHMPAGNTYTASSHFGDVMRTAKGNKNSAVYQSGLMLYGKGDGGGGPTAEMLEKMRRIRSMNNRNGNIIPKLHVGSTINDFYNDILKKTNDGQNLPSWLGELYFEFHRGTYTTQAQLKRLMRLCEVKIHDLEWLATKASLLYAKDYEYPVNKINELWEDILLCQFHDVLPGSCIELVYKYEARPMLSEALEKIEKMISHVLKVLQKKGSKLVTVGTLQSFHSGKDAVSSDYKTPVTIEESEISIKMINGNLEVTIDKKKGVISSITETERDIEYLDLESGKNRLGANQFVLFDDKPLGWQAWDTEVYSLDQFEYISTLESIRVSDSSSEKCAVELTFKVKADCDIVTTISLKQEGQERSGSMIEIDTVVKNWNLTNKFLKVEFPVNVRNDYASYETQFGITKRPTHYNTSWDVAKFEVCHHKFADYSEFSKGVSVINNCKYGFSTHGNLMRLSLLRSPKQPDEHADMGTHHMKYAIFPHKGSLSHETVHKALDFNYCHKYQIPDSVAQDFGGLIKIEGDPNVILMNIKRGEDDKELGSEYSSKSWDQRSMVIRVYEALGGESSATLSTDLPLTSALKIDSLELTGGVALDLTREDFKEAKGQTQVRIKLKPFEIGTYRFVF
ncbi:LANO_0H05952g1_1 [Lachancea nothofagi CBS 11611]|uniref:Alpha-mannosidase n=1 Tax=Lachancea nothofagi CBS 11611 TaxID=1266666 RepID=A0A1G4KLE4_9SACH|nr:LANO_0H05952g1_1 [Lachancea nothofagi CBS 11611]